MSSQVQLWRVSLPASDGDAALSSRAPPASAARLITLACDIYQLCLESLAKRLSKPLYRKVERPYGYLRLWADGYGVSSGELDKVLADSTRLRRSTVRLLVSLCRTLTNHLVSFVGEAGEAGLLHQLSTQAKDLLETTAYSIHNGESSDSDSDSDNDSAPSFGELSIKEIAADLETDVQCLVDLKPRYEEPVRDRPPVEKVARLPEENTTWNPAEYLASRIRHRYPNGQSDLVAILGRNNWDRMLRLAKAREQKAQQPVEGNKEQKAATSVSRSEFHDSGLGTSIATPSSYAETVVSYHGSKGGSIKIPPLPAEAAGGKPFICGVCGDSIKISNTTLWKRHILQDLRPYTCLVGSCKFGLAALLDKRMWTEHLKLEHGFPGSLEGLACPFCQQAAGTDESAFVSHLGHHLEEISLMILHTNTGDAEIEGSSDEESSPRSLLGEAPEAKPLDDDYNSPLGDSEPRAQQVLQPEQRGIQQNSSQQHTATNEPEILIAGIGDETVLDTGVGSEPAPGSGEVDSSDVIKLHGGLSVNGLPAELVRVTKDGKAFSLATGDSVELHEEIKAPVSIPARSTSQELEDEIEIMRALAWRKKNPAPNARRKCNFPGCNKQFLRPCDLTKHEKTHSRPWKCPVSSCKYHEYGWPTEKERDRHHDDEHAPNPKMYQCRFETCHYESKRESNCIQHMEKAHNWTSQPSRRSSSVKNRPTTPTFSGTRAEGPLLSGTDAFDPTALLQLPTPPSRKSVGPTPVSLFTQPLGQRNAMLITPESLADVDEGFEDFPGGVNTAGLDFVFEDFPGGVDTASPVMLPTTQNGEFSSVPFLYSQWEHEGAGDGTSL